ncbi:MAG TPA: cytochrome c oxidase subunit I, partial [Candidatus Dormibacteraeota bacterium]|nr:cytochrome c oxidase subunit I [Candidatus Dormibacteraeota bacterium]
GNFVSSIAAFVLGAAMVVFAYNLVSSWLRGERAPRNPWHAKTLEWQVPTPVPLENFEEIPVITAWPYDYGSGEAGPEPAPGPAPA